MPNSLSAALADRRQTRLGHLGKGPGSLIDNLEARLLQGPVKFNLVLQMAGEGDPTDDPNAPWPEDRPRVTVGQLAVTRPTTTEEIGDSVMMHDPTRVTDGIELSDALIVALAAAFMKCRSRIAPEDGRAAKPRSVVSAVRLLDATACCA